MAVGVLGPEDVVTLRTEKKHKAQISAADFPLMHKNSVGNIGIRLKKGDSVIEASV